LFKLPHQPLKGVIRDIRGGTRPSHDQPRLVENLGCLYLIEVAQVGCILDARSCH
jgi:hypothetical protein